MVCDVEFYVEEDCKFEELVVVCNQVDGMIYVIKKILEEVEEKVEEGEKEVIEFVIIVLEEVLKGDDKDDIDEKIKVLMEVLVNLVQCFYVEQ